MRIQVLTLAVAASLAGSGCSFYGETGHAKNPRRFDAQQWELARSDVWSDVRCDMVDDLRERVGIKGRSRDEVIALLGEPGTHGDTSDLYDLCPSFMDFWVLEVQYEDGRVVSTLVRDT